MRYGKNKARMMNYFKKNSRKFSVSFHTSFHTTTNSMSFPLKTEYNSFNDPIPKGQSPLWGERKARVTRINTGMTDRLPKMGRKCTVCGGLFVYLK